MQQMGAEKTNHWKTIEYKDGPGPAGGAHRVVEIVGSRLLLEKI